MPRLHLTDRALRSLSSDKVQEDVFDSSFRGHGSGAFGVRVSRAGRRSFFVRYRASGRNRRVQLGDYPSVKLTDARKAATAVLAEVARHHDPAAVRDRHQEGPTFAELAAEYMERHAKVRKRTWREDARMLRRDLLPEWGGLKAGEITKADVLRVLDRKVDAGTPIAANRLLSSIRKIFNWGIERDLVTDNPCTGVKPPAPERRRERVLSETEIVSLWRAVGRECQPIRAAFHLLLLTAQRSIEVLSMRWSHIDGDLWTLPAGIVKGKRSHVMPLSPQVRKLLGGLERSEGEDWVLTSPRRRDSPLAGTSLSHAALRLRQTVDFDWRPHDLRRTTASHMAALGVRRFVLGRILNHADPSVTAIYDRHSYLPEMRQALSLWGSHLEKLVEGEGVDPFHYEPQLVAP